MVTMNILTSALLDFEYNLPVLFVINLFNILDDDICHTLFIVFALFVQLQERCRNSVIHRYEISISHFDLSHGPQPQTGQCQGNKHPLDRDSRN